MIGTQEMVMIFAAILLLFGANKLPELARSMGSAAGEFKKAQTESERNLREYEKSLKEPIAAKNKIQETAEKIGIDIRGKTDDQLLDEIQNSAQKPREISAS